MYEELHINKRRRSRWGKSNYYFFVFSLREKNSLNLTKSDRRFFLVLAVLNLDDDVTVGSVVVEAGNETSFESLGSSFVEGINELVTSGVS